jgi:hypothetical protein
MAPVKCGMIFPTSSWKLTEIQAAVKSQKTASCRTAKYYDGTSVTTHKIEDLLGKVLSQIHDAYGERSDLILDSWPEIIGPKLAEMTKAVSCCKGILTVQVKNSTLHSLLTRYDKFRILEVIQKRFPNAAIRDIVFKNA